MMRLTFTTGVFSFAISTGDDPEADSKTDEGSAGVPAVSSAPARRTGSRKSSVACSDCGVLITDKVKSFSEQRYGKSLCMDCQKNYAAA